MAVTRRHSRPGIAWLLVALAVVLAEARRAPADKPSRCPPPSSDLEPADPKPPRKVAPKDGWASALVKYGTVAALTLATCAIVAGIFEGGYVIATLGVPDDLAKAGLDGQAIASLIRDRTAALLSRSRLANNPDLQSRAGKSESDGIALKIGGTDLPVRAIAMEVATRFGLAPPRIAGSLWHAAPTGEPVDPGSRGPGQGTYRLALRDDHGGKAIVECEGRLDELVERAAVAVLGTIDPTAAADYLRTAGPEGRLLALSMAEEGVRRARSDENSVWSRLRTRLLLGRYGADLPTALVAKASVLSAMGDYRGALEFFDVAQAASSRAGDRASGDQALDGRGYAAMQQAQREGSREAFEADLLLAERVLTGIAERYDSSAFHLAEIQRLRFERQLKDEACAAGEAFERADGSYRAFEGGHPQFAVAMLQHAVMLKSVSGFMQFQETRSRSCVGMDRFGDIAWLHSEAERLFRTAAALDPTDATAWLEWGILTHEGQKDTREWHPGRTWAQRAVSEEEAIAKMSKAAEADRRYAFVDRRIADAVVTRLDIADGRNDEREHKAELRKFGLRAACRGLRLPSDDSRPDLLRLARALGGSDKVACIDADP